MNTYLFHLATIRMLSGTLEVYWSYEERAIRYVCGSLWFQRPNDTIRSSLAALFGCLPSHLDTRSLVLQEYIFRTVFHDADKMSRELLDCEWSDYAMDRMSFQIHLALDECPNVRLDQFEQLRTMELDEEDPVQ